LDSKIGPLLHGLWLVLGWIWNSESNSKINNEGTNYQSISGKLQWNIVNVGTVVCTYPYQATTERIRICYGLYSQYSHITRGVANQYAWVVKCKLVITVWMFGELWCLPKLFSTQLYKAINKSVGVVWRMEFVAPNITS
jgi:hypothetical protein